MREKPQSKTMQYFDYHECRDFIEEKYKIKVRDYAGMFTDKTADHTKPYLDFWHYLLDCFPNITNGSFFEIDSEMLEGAEEWQKEILTMFLDEFGTKDTTGFIEGKRIKFYVWW